MRARFTKMSGNVPDSFAKEGELALTVNSILREGSVRPLPPLPEFSPLSEGDTVTVGNITATVTDDGILYAMQEGTGKKILGSRPPEAAISFGMLKAGLLNGKERMEVAASCLPVINQEGGWSTDTLRNPPSAADLEELSGLLNRQINDAIRDTVETGGYVWQPFFVRFAYRMFDGSHCFHSPPILMTPVTTVPQICLSDLEDAGDGRKRCDSTLRIPYFRLICRIGPTASLSDLAGWGDVIAGIDIFVSAPVKTYDTERTLPKVPYCSARNFYLSGRPGRSMDISTESPTGTIFTGTYSEGEEDPFADHETELSSLNGEEIFWRLPVNPNFSRDIESAATFYHVAHLPISLLCSVTATTDIPVGINLTEGSETLSDDYLSRHDILPACLATAGGRLVAGGIDMRIPKPFPLSLSLPPQSGDQHLPITMAVRTRSRGRLSAREVTHGATQVSVRPLSSSFPRYIYYPDRSAWLLSIYREGEGVYEIPLTPHPTLNGAYFFGGLATSAELAVRYKSGNSMPTLAEAGLTPMTGGEGSRIIVSLASNPFVFPAGCSGNVGSGCIRALIPLSKGYTSERSGQYPLCAIADDGVWTVEISREGEVGGCRFVGTRWRAEEAPRRVITLSSGGVFISDGKVYRLDGNTVVALPQLPAYSDTLYPGLSPDSRLVFDAAEELLYILPPGDSPVYIYSFSEDMWSVCDDNTKSATIVTRPFRLDQEGAPHRIKEILMEGIIDEPKDITMILYGSYDLSLWHPIGHGATHIRLTDGNPYRYYRVKITIAMSPDATFTSYPEGLLIH